MPETFSEERLTMPETFSEERLKPGSRASMTAAANADGNYTSEKRLKPGSRDRVRMGSRPGWYIVQVRTGQEARMCEVIRRACAEHDKNAERREERIGLKECFSPRFLSQKKWKGEWVPLERPLLPGYVVTDVERPALLAQQLRGIRDLCHVLAAEKTYEPLDDFERTWIDSYTSKGERVVPMSFGYKEGEKLVVERGPLRGNEAMVEKVDRANCLAHLELHVGQMTIRTTVGLGIVPKELDIGI